MNHYLLQYRPTNQKPRSTDAPNDDNRHGEQAIEALIDGMLRGGAQAGNLESKIVGGGKVLNSSESTGQLNERFAHDFLVRSGIPIVAADVGRTAAQKIILDAGTGRVRVLKLTDSARERIVSGERKPIASTSS